MSSVYPLSAGGRPQRRWVRLTQRTCLTAPTYRTKPALQKSPLQGRFVFVEGGDATTGDSVKPLYPHTTNLYPGGTMMKRTIAFLLVLTVLVAGVTGCGTATKVTEQIVNLGGIQPMTGGAATFGASGKNGAVMAVGEFNAAGGATVS